MRNPPITELLIVLGLAFAMWLASTAVYDARKSGDALRWLQAERTGTSPFTWSFDTMSDLGNGHGVDAFIDTDSVLSGDGDDPYFYLNLRGRFIDARRFDRLRIRVYSETENQLRLFHLQGRPGQIHASRRIPLAKGWQELELDLPDLDWQAKDLAHPEQPDQPSSWGDDEGLVTALRVDPVVQGGFAVDEIRLESSGEPWPISQSAEAFDKLDSPLFDRMRSEPRKVWVIAEDRILRTPESAHRTRQLIAREFPSAILFPRPPGDDQFSAQAPDSPTAPRAWPALMYVLGLGLLLGTSRPRGGEAAPRRSLLEFAGFLLLFQGCLFLFPQIGSLFSLVIALPLLLAAWAMNPNPEKSLVFGDARAWLLVSPLMLAGLLAFWTIPLPETVEGPVTVPLVRTLAQYFLWALLQQYVVAVLVMGRLEPLLGRIGVILSAGFFGWLHFPNFVLMMATFLLGLVLLAIYRRHPNLPAIAAAQAFLSVGFNSLALHYLWLSREIGPAFLSTL